MLKEINPQSIRYSSHIFHLKLFIRQHLKQKTLHFFFFLIAKTYFMDIFSLFFSIYHFFYPFFFILTRQKGMSLYPMGERSM